MRLPHRVFVVALLCVACGTAGRGLPDLTAFDTIITPELITAGYRQKVPLAFGVVDNDSTRVYWSQYQFTRADPAEHYTCAITVAKAGQLLDRREHEERYRRFQRDYADRGPDYLVHEFPHIGRRAQREFIAFGPGGAAFGLAFTTSDGRYDLRIVVSNLLPNGVDDPDCDVDATAKRISDLYDKYAGEPANGLALQAARG
ncbi:MAG: hypothetical protein ACRET3_05105 [Burkholderiales bacterium]